MTKSTSRKPKCTRSRRRRATTTTRNVASRARRSRRSPAQVAKILDRAVVLLCRAGGRMRAEHLRAALRLDRRAFTSVLAEGVRRRQVRRRGRTRGTFYAA